MEKTLQEHLANVPEKPGVYLMKDQNGRILYVGKAQSLKKRVMNYFKASGIKDVKTAALAGKIAWVDTIITGSEKEALILEANLIKKHAPHYNVILKDGKRYPFLRIDMQQDYPAIEVVRKVKKDKALYFGPYVHVHAVGQTLKIIHRTFPLRKCKNRRPPVRSRPCLNFQMGRCLAPCCNEVSPEKYREMLDEVVLLLNGKAPALLDKIRVRMLEAAQNEDFEQAALLRDRMHAVEKTVERQVVVTADMVDRDVIAFASRPGAFAITLMHIRGGSLVGSRDWGFEAVPLRPGEAVAAFIRQYYEKDQFVPGQILVSGQVENRQILEEWLGDIAGRRVHISSPLRGEKAQIVQRAVENADQAATRILSAEESVARLLDRLALRLKLAAPPRRIECLDISHTGGGQTVGGLTVFADANPKKADYRSYSVNNVPAGDDYGAMKAVLARRFARMKEDALPDLLLLDGGRGQLSVACAVLDELGLANRLSLAGIAKKDERKKEQADKIYLPGQLNPVVFGRDADLLLFLARIRDETHRFAVSVHRKKRGKNSRASVLDDIPGIGPKRKAALLKHFGSVKRILAATDGQIAQVEGMSKSLAGALKKSLQMRQALKQDA
jgi:excinuclease ABC subunit C